MLRLLGLVLLLGALALLNHAAFSLWIAGGPPGPHKLGWERESLHSLLKAIALLLASTLAFGYGRLFRFRWTLGVLILSLLAVPPAHKFLLQDSCLDSGGRWLPEAIECER